MLLACGFEAIRGLWEGSSGEEPKIYHKQWLACSIGVYDQITCETIPDLIKYYLPSVLYLF